MKSKLTAALASFQKKYARQSYSYCDPSLKLSMHRAAMRLLRLLAATLGYQPNSFDVWSNKAGIAVSGEITLHADDLYVQISESAVMRGGLSAMIRGCRGRKDYSGLNNMFLALSDARVDALLNLCGKAKVESETERDRARPPRLQKLGMSKETIAIVEWIRGDRRMSELMSSAGLGISGVGVKERVTLTYKAGEVVDEARVMRALEKMQAESDARCTPFVIHCPKVIAITTKPEGDA